MASRVLNVLIEYGLYFSALKIRTVKQVANVMCEQTSSKASCLVPHVQVCGNKCFL